MEDKKPEKGAGPLELLSILRSGFIKIDVDGVPLLELNATSRALDVQTAGVKKAGIKISNFVKLETGGKRGVSGLLKGAEPTARELSERGWRLTLWDNHSKVITVGRGVSKLTGHIGINLLKLHRILEAL